MKRFATPALFIIPLLVAAWVGFFYHNALRKTHVINSYMDMQEHYVRQMAEEGAALHLLFTRAPVSGATLDSLAGRLPSHIQSRSIIVRNGTVLTSTFAEFAPDHAGLPLLDFLKAQAAHGGKDFGTLATLAVRPGTGRTTFTWSAARGLEHAVWATAPAGDDLFTVIASAPQSTILNTSGLLGHIQSETLVLLACSALFLLLMLVLIRQRNEADAYRHTLEDTVADRTEELTRTNHRLRNSLERRRQAEEALRASEEKYRLLVENQNDVLVRVNRMGRLEFASPSYCDMLGIPEPDIVGTRFLSTIHEEDRRTIFDATRALEHPPHTFQVETKTLTRHGVRWVSWAGRAIRGAHADDFSEIVGIGRDITDMVRARESISASLAEKELLLQEIHHRVKNNLQIICGLLDLASRRLHSPQDMEVFKDVHSKIQSMSLIHSQLYQSDQFDRIDMSAYASALFTQLSHMYGAGNMRASLDTQPVPLSINMAIPCGLVLNEMLTNIFKHAFDASGGTVRISLRRTGDDVHLSVSDDGCGLPENWEDIGEHSMGIKLMRNIIQFQLGGELTVQTGGGAAFDIIFPFEGMDPAPRRS